MSSDIKQVMSHVVAQLCYQVGFDRISESALDLLVDVGEQYMRNIACTVAKVSSLCGGASHLEDGILALRLLKQSPRNLGKFVRDVGPHFPPQAINSAIPLSGKVCLNIPPMNHEELKHRPAYIPDYLPLNFKEPEPVDLKLSVFARKAVLEPPTSAVNGTQLQSTNPAGTNTTTTSTIATSRVLPAWAQQSSYRITRISVDPVTKTLVEHAPPEKTQDLSPDVPPVSRNYGQGTGISMFSDTQKFDGKMGALHGAPSSSIPSTSYRQGATDEQWAAALQATPVTLAKRIVYTPSRFDPSVVPTHSSSMRRPNSAAIFSSTNRRFSNSQKLDSAKMRPVHKLRSNKNKVQKLTTNRRRRSAFGRPRRWSRGRNMKKNSVASDTADVVAEPILADVSERSPSADKTPELKADHRSPYAFSPAFGLDQADSGSDRTPPATSPCAALLMHKSNGTDSPANAEPPTADPCSNVKIEEVHGDQTIATTPNSVHSSLIEMNMYSSPRNHSPVKPTSSPTCIPSPILPDKVDEERVNVAPAVLPNPVRARLRGARKNRTRRRPAAFNSIINSLFQNPLRKNPITKTPSIKKPVNGKASNIDEHISNSRGMQNSTKETSDVNRPIVSTQPQKDHIDKSVHSRRKRVPAACNKKVRHKENTEPKSVLQNTEQSAIASPASDSTEPMLDSDRASLLFIPQCPSGKPTLDKDFGKSALVTSVSVPTEKTELRPTLYPGKNFDKPRNLAPIAVRALPSSPSSLESSPTSISSTSTSLLDGPIIDHVPVRDLNFNPKENVTTSVGSAWKEDVLDPEYVKTPSIQASKETCHTTDGIPSSVLSIASTRASSSTSKQNSNSSGPPPLLPLNKRSLDESTNVHLTPLSNNTNNSGVVPPSSLMAEVHGSPSPTAPSTVSIIRAGSHASVPSSTSGGLRIKIRFGTSDVRESITSSLSPSSSSTSLSSGSSPSSPYITERMPAPLRDLSVPPPSPLTIDPKERTSNHAPDAKLLTASAAPDPVTTGKAPKLVIRLGANGRAQSSKPLSTEQPIGTITRTNPVAPVAGSSSSININPTLPPPPLQLTITRDRLSYRGQTTSDASDSNLSSSSGTESLLSSGEDDEPVPAKYTSLPPPPSLERLPDRGNSSTSISIQPSHLSSSRYNEAPVPEKGSGSEIPHNHLPPLFPLFSSTDTQKTALKQVSTPPNLSSIDEFRSGSASGPPSTSSSRKKRPPSARKDIRSSSKRRYVAGDLTEHPKLNCLSIKPDFSGGATSRVRVDSVFTDNESDEDGVLQGSGLSTVNPAERTIQDRPRGFKDEHTSSFACKNPSDKAKRTQPRTKHTANISKCHYPPAIKTVTNKSPQSVSISRDRITRRHLTSSSSSTGSSGTKTRITVGSHRSSSSQIVVASAGSSYYFVSVLLVSS